MFLISPRNGKISDLGDELVVAQDTQSRLQVQIAALEEIRDREVEFLAAVGRLDALIPDRPLLDEFIEEVHALSEDTGVHLQTLSPSLPTPASDGSVLREIPVSMQIEGDFFDLLGFLFGLSDMERLARVDAVSLSSTTAEDGATILSASLEVNLFTLADVFPTEGFPGDQPVEGENPNDPPTTTTPGDDFEANEEESTAGGGG